jgi:propanol-preferring alcohol dehydrogenase
MRAVQLSQPNPIESKPLQINTVETPTPGQGEILLDVNVCGACHTDLHIAEGDISPPSLPIIPGHQVVGRVEALGEGVKRWEIGQRVGVPWLHRACGECRVCLSGQENLCPQAVFTGFDVNGGFADKMVADARYVLPLPEGVDDVDAAPLLCAGIIGYRSLRQADLEPGESLGLVGFGASAHLAIQVAKHWGCQVYVFSRTESHRDLAQKLGAVWTGQSDQDPPEQLDRVVLFAPVGALVPVMLRKLRPGGTLAINAIHTSPIPEMSYETIYGERTLRTVANATYQDGVEFMELAAKISLQVTTNLYPLEEVNQALEDMKHSRIDGEAVLRLD